MHRATHDDGRVVMAAKAPGLPRGPRFPGKDSGKTTYTTHQPKRTGQDKKDISRRSPKGSKTK